MAATAGGVSTASTVIGAPSTSGHCSGLVDDRGHQ
jgi:hypothetical protein